LGTDSLNTEGLKGQYCVVLSCVGARCSTECSKNY